MLGAGSLGSKFKSLNVIEPNIVDVNIRATDEIVHDIPVTSGFQIEED